MKLIYFAAFMLFQHSSFFSQLSNLTFDKHPGFWSLAAHYGSAYQSSDVPSEKGGWGTDLSLAKNLYFNKNAWFSVDLRSRLSFASTKGLDHNPNNLIADNEVLNGEFDFDYTQDEYPGYIFNNYKNGLADISLETNILWNKNRTMDKWFLNFYGGAGIGLYNTRMNLADQHGDYALRYAEIDLNDSKRDTRKSLRSVMDDTYESQAEGFTGGGALRINWMPSLGLEFGYDINHYLTAIAGHRSVISRTDRLDGDIRSERDNQDLLHFTHLGLQVNFQKKDRPGYTSYDRAKLTSYDAIDKDPESGYPHVRIIYPEIDWFNTSQSEIEVIGSLKNVYSVLDISCMVNGKEVAFDYNKDEVKFYASLQRGTNVLKVQVRNDKGEARDIKRVVFTPEEIGNDEEVNTPVIELESPATEVHYAEEDIFSIQAYFDNVDSRDDVKLSANGMELNTFKYDADLGQLFLKVRLAKGKNSFILTAYNSFGKTEKAFTVYYDVDPDDFEEEEEEVFGDSPEPKENDKGLGDHDTKPHISILSPGENPFYIQGDKVFLQAEMHGAVSKESIVFKINGKTNYFFDFDAHNQILEDEIHLMDINTKVELTVSNQYGSTTKVLEIVYGDKPADQSQVEEEANAIIEFIENGKADEDCFANYEVRINAQVDKKEIKLSLNAFEVRNFRYDKNTGTMLFSLYLDEGKNEIGLEVDLGDRIEKASQTIYCGDVPEDEGEVEYVDTSPASIVSVDPKSGSISEEEEIILHVRLQHVQAKDDLLIFLNEELVRNIEFDPYDNEAMVMLSLLPKENFITVRAENEYGYDERELMIYYDEPFKSPPVVLINSPRNGFTTDEDQITFRASVENIKSIENVTVLFNGEILTDIHYNEQYGKVQAYLPLKLGENIIEVKANNRLGESSEKVKFKYKLEHIPAIDITGPKEGLEYRKAFAMLTAVIQNMPDKRGIGIQINGKPFKSLSYDKETETMTSRIRLDKGNNEIILSAKNEFGFASDTIRLFFKGAPEKPSITFINPADENSRTSESTFAFEASVLEISHSSHAELSLNGRNIEEVYYYRDEKKIKAELQLKKGLNRIVLVARNDTGTSTARTSIYLN